MDLKTNDEIQWWYNRTLIAKIKGDDFTTYEGDDARFRDKLTKADNYGDLVIRNTRSIHSGLYKLEVKSKIRTSCKRFNITVKGGYVSYCIMH